MRRKRGDAIDTEQSWPICPLPQRKTTRYPTYETIEN